MTLIHTLLAFVAPLVAFAPGRQIISKPAPDPMTVHGLIAWLETQPPARTYSYTQLDHCLFAKYAESLGYGKGRRALRGYCAKFPMAQINTDVGLPHWGNEIATASYGGENFGAALKRARAYARAAHNEVR